jgi:predicted CopG family antitoxin
MAKYSTISVPEEIKEALEQNKGNKEWGEYLMELYKKAEEERKRQAFTKLTDILSDEDYENMKKSSEKFREEFKLR